MKVRGKIQLFPSIVSDRQSSFKEGDISFNLENFI